jgi:Tol biopolymer transport system component
VNQGDQPPTWSPDCRWIAFTESYGEGGQSQILKVRDVGGTPVVLTPFDLNANNAKWSPDETRILFNSHNDKKPGISANLYTVTPDRHRLVQLTHYRSGRLDAYADCWSPDAKEIVFHLRGTHADGSSVNQLFIMNAAGGNLRQLTHLSGDMNPGYADWN